MKRSPDTPSFLDIRRRFNFRSIEIGRWVTEAEKQNAAVQFYRALCDLMTILGGPEPLISLRGTLALQYGTGGQLGVAAHYAPGRRTFALAKNAGPGSIAHEWFHAFDHYICCKAYPDIGGSLFASNAWVQKARRLEHPLNRLLDECYAAVLQTTSGEPSEMVRQSLQADKQARVHYYAQPEELCARAFEAFVQDASIGNRFLVKGTRQSEEARQGLYPHGAHRARINRAFGAYFSRLGRALSQQVAVRS